MAYVRKTRDQWMLLANYGQGWEEETWEDSRQAAKAQLRCYRENAPQYQYKTACKRIRLASEVQS